MNILTSIFVWLRTRRREQVVDERDKNRALAAELDKLADLMVEVLKVTDAGGRIQNDKLPELDIIRKRVWNRWVSILGSSGYATRDSELQAEIEKCIRVAHAAPGAYVEEVYLAQIGILQGYIPLEVRARFSRAIHSLQDLTARMRLDA